MSTINNNLRTNLIGNNKLGLRAAFNNKNLANLQAGKNAVSKPLKRTALTQSTNLLKENGKLGSKQTNNIIKKSNVLTGAENENNEYKTKIKLCPKKSKIPKIVSPKVTQTKDVTKKSKINVSSAESKALEKLEDKNLIKFSSFVIPENVENIDTNDGINVLLAPGYTNDIYTYLSHLEDKYKIKSNFLQIQQQMNFKMRARLVDWIIAVHHKYKLLPETLYLTVAIIDRFFEKVNVLKEKVQLVGVTAFFIACKYEEIYPPEITDFIKVCDAYSKNEILKMEKTILKTLNFVLSYPLPLHFLRRFSKAAHADQEIHTLAKYLMELGLLEYECASWKPSLLAAASLYLTLHILNDDNDSHWTETLAFYSSYKEIDLQKHVSYLCKVLIKTKDSKLQTVKNKFSNAKLLCISENPKLKSEYVLNMATKDDN